MLATAQGPRSPVASSMIPSAGTRSTTASAASSKSSYDPSWLASSSPSRRPTRWGSTCPERTCTIIRAIATT
jgi:hypothetical protein